MKNNKKIFSILLLAIILAFSNFTNIFASESVFSDMKTSHWAYPAVNTMSQKGIVKGYPDGTFRPQGTVTYAEYIKMATIADTGVDVGNSSSGHWALNYYDKALELGYFNKYQIAEEQLNEDITRGKMALIASAVLGAVDIPNKKYTELEFSVSDVDATVEHDYHIIKSYACGIITGYEDNTFRPEDVLTRAEAATTIYRLIDEAARVVPDIMEDTIEDKLPESEKGSDLNYEIRKTSEFITDVSKYPYYANLERLPLHWSENCKYYEDADDLNFNIRIPWGTEPIPERIVFDLELMGFMFAVSGGEIVEELRYTDLRNDEGDFITSCASNNHPSNWEYIIAVCCANCDSPKEVIVIKNPMK